MRNPRNDRPRLTLSSRPREGSAEGLSKSAPGAEPPSKAKPAEPERTCILSRRKGTKDELIRLAVGPDNSIAPDVRARAPGRGAWIGADRAELDAANASGKLKSALQRAFRTHALTIPPDLGERTQAALRQYALDRLGMEARAGNLINGSERVESAARAGQVHLLLHAADAGEDGRRSLDQALRVGGRVGGDERGLIFPEPRTILSMALGRENVVHVALTDPAAASRVRHALVRWLAFTGPERGPEGGEPAFGTNSADEDLKE